MRPHKTKVSFDFETYSTTPIKDHGAWVYSEHGSTEVLCMAYAYAEDEPRLWLPDEPLPEFITSPTDYDLTAWNSFFELCIWRNTQHWPEAPIECWHDTMAQAAAQALPLALGKCGVALGLPANLQKDKRGKQLIQKLCKPQRRKDKPDRRITDPDMMQELYDYCLQDVVTERAIGRLLRPLNPTERKVWVLDQEINVRGVPIDRVFTDQAVILVETVSTALNQELSEITGGEVTAATQLAKIKEHLERYDLRFRSPIWWDTKTSHEIGRERARLLRDENAFLMRSMDKAALTTILAHNDLHPTTRRVLEIRQVVSRTSNAKFRALQNTTGSDGRTHGTMQYHAASTGRWGGRMVQPHNMPRPILSKKDVDIAHDLVREGNGGALERIWGDPLEALSSTIRGVVTASKGKRLLVVDFAAIEARVLCWLAGQEDVLEIFRNKGDVYEHAATGIFHVLLGNITSEQRMVGKVAILALGFQGAVRALQSMAVTYALDEFEEEHAERIVKDWRNANTAIAGVPKVFPSGHEGREGGYWKDIQYAATRAVEKHGEVHTVRSVSFVVHGAFLYCKLPSGRFLSYYAPAMGAGDYGPQLTYMGMDSHSHQWTRLHTYGGKLVENITQAVARDLMAEAMLRLDNLGYKIVMTVHDEVVAELPEGEGTTAEMEQIMCEVPPWAPGLPIAAEGYESKRYRK